MTAEALWELFACTGLPEAYSLYRRTVSGVPEILQKKAVRAGWNTVRELEHKIPGT